MKTGAFSEATFTGQTWFSEATFVGHALFSKATFNDHLWFDRAVFDGDASFSDATFNGNAWFYDTRVLHLDRADAVEADPDALPGQGHADADLSAADADPAAAVDDPVHLHRRHVRGDGGQRGEGPAGRPPSVSSRARSRCDSRDGQLLILAPSWVRTWIRSVSAHTVMGRPARAGPSQICCRAIIRLPEAGTIRSICTGADRPATVVDA